MEMTQVNSSNLAAIGYNSETAILRVEFLYGAIYEYYSVPEEIYQGLLYADSKGTYFNAYIKKGGYAFAKL